MREKKKATETILTEQVMLTFTNHYGTLYGGRLLELMDKAAFIATSRFACSDTVTASSESVDFHHPIRFGDIIELSAKVIFTGKTSMVVRIHAYGEDRRNHKKFLATTGYFNMVAVDENGKPKEVPELLVETEEEKGERKIGKRIKELSKERLARKRPGGC
jgi:acyl-CoA hydrolase